MDYENFEHIRPDLTEEEFEQLALEIFRFQARENPVYSQYVKYLGIKPGDVDSIEQIPFLPIEFFKNHRVITRYYDQPDEKFVKFRSSGTTGMQRSTHFIYNIHGYERSFFTGFEYFYGTPGQYAILALLPSYLERGDSSLVYMAGKLIDATKNPYSGFYLYNYGQLYQTLERLKKTNQKTILLGVSFALLDFVEYKKIDFPGLIVMETGGMKGRKREMVRQELHDILCRGFGVEKIHSEYGMTELLSQAYSQGNGKFRTPPWMKILIRDTNDPFSYVEQGRTGGINVIDLANVYSCAFIETKDLGRINADGSFEVLGRFDNSDLRGCNLMVA